MPDLDDAEIVHRAEEKRHQQEPALSDNEDDFAVGAVDDRATEGREKYPRQTQTQPFQSQIKGRVGQLKNQPALRGGVNQGAGVAEQQATPKNKIVTVAKGAKGVGEHSLGEPGSEIELSGSRLKEQRLLFFTRRENGSDAR